MRTGRTLSWIVALAGLWQLISPFVLGFSTVAVALWDSVIVGIILIVLGVWAALSHNSGTDQALDWINALLGVWDIIGPFVLGFAVISAAALWSTVIVGIIVLVLGVVAALEFRAPTPRAM